MKKLLLFILVPFLSFGQTQIGDDIDGEASGDLSGFSVSLANNGNTVAIGAYFNGLGIAASGHARIYENIEGIWIQIGNDIDIDTPTSHLTYVNLSEDGSVIAVGGYKNLGNFNFLGQVRVFKNIDGEWSQIGDNIIGGPDVDYFGYSVSLSSDGSILAMGGHRNNENGIDSGHVQVYENIYGKWNQIGEDIYGEAEGDHSGFAISLSNNGSIVAIGAYDNNDNGNNSGHVRVFKNINGEWNQLGNSIDGDAVSDSFGIAVDLSTNGNKVAIGGYQNDDNGINSGHVRIFENIDGEWNQIGNDIYGEAEGDESGFSLSLSSDGNILAIGDHFSNANGLDSGQVRLYQYIDNLWTQIGNNIKGEEISDQSGQSVSLSSNGNIVAIGAPYNDGNGQDSGHVRVYDLSQILSLNEQITKNNFIIYPNPTSKKITIQLQENQEVTLVKIYNTLGQLVQTETKNTFDISPLTTGSYYIQVTTNEGDSIQKLLVE